MVHCPNCSKNIAVSEDNYGTLYRCEYCQSEFFIGFDGAPENSKEPILAGNDTADDSELAVNINTADMAINVDSTEINAHLNSGGQGSGDIFNIEPNQSGLSVDASSNDLYAVNANQNETTIDQNQMTGVSSTASAFNDFTKDVRDFGNDVGTIGILSFDIEISGIDLGEIKRELLDALNDKRFGWNLGDLSQKIKDGKLAINDISAPKIIVLVKRITPLGLSLNWRHHVSTQ